jgi:hypothetical protein
MAAFRSNLPAFIRAMDDAAPKGLHAAAYVVQNKVKENLRGGYKSGAFVTGHVMNSVTIGQVYREGTGWAIRVGSNVEYALWWEVGHNNRWTRQYERSERWRPALVDSRFEAMSAFNRVYTLTLKEHGF